MSEPHDPNVTDDRRSAPTGSLRASDPLGPTDHVPEAGSTLDSPPADPPGADVPAKDLPTVPGYRVLRAIARGGMGRVLAAHDLGLDREVALKVLLPGANADRFLREAKITARLPHPGIPPVHALGTLPDGSPFLAMKLIAGRTLADEMKSTDRPRLLQAFTQVCQAVGFAHSQGVIHRDLKPLNVMVGAFGEVQVMDWGLAKDLTGPEVADDPVPPEALAAPDVGTDASRTTDHPDPGELTGVRTRAGQVLGTPAYMAPEQARGEPADARADVFALGGILCAILTGRPPFGGPSARDAIRRAGAADLGEAFARLDGCGAAAELVALCRRCLSPAPEDRPADGQAVADELTAYLNGVQQRLQAAERERAVAVVRASEERRRRRVQFVLAASVLALTTLGGLSTAYYLRQRQARAAAVERVVGQTETLLNQAREQPEDLSRWQVALAAAEQVESGGDATAHGRLLELRTEIQAGLGAAQRDRTLLDRVIDIRSAEADDPDGSVTDHDYADAFREAGIDFAGLTPAEAGARIRARPPSVALELAAALDEWARVRLGRRADAAGSAGLREAARAADPHPWRNELRSALGQPDRAARLSALQALAKTARFEELGPVSLQLLGTSLGSDGDGALAESVLRSAQQRHPRDVWVNYALGSLLEKLSRRDEAIRFYTAARAVRPETAHALAHALDQRGDSDEALAVFRDLRRLRPGNPRHLGCLGLALKKKGLSREADEAFEAVVVAGREATRLRPTDAIARVYVGVALEGQGKYDEALAEWQTAVRLRPDLAHAHYGIGLALSRQGKMEEAVPEYRTAIRLNPDLVEAHGMLGNALARQGKHDDAIAEYRTVIRLKPDDEKAHHALGVALSAQGKLDEAITAYRTTVRLKPDHPLAHYLLGNALGRQGQLDEAVAEFREAVRLKPDLALAHYDLGTTLANQGKLDEAIPALRTAIRLKPDDAEAHCNVGGILREQGDYAGALELLRRGHELGSRRPGWRYPSAQWVAEAERDLALVKRLPALLRGEDKPADNAERLAFARIASHRKHYAASTRLWAEALASDTRSADDLTAGHRYGAARSASLAAAGRGEDAAKLDGGERARLRQQSLIWLRADLALRRRQLASGQPADRGAVQQALRYWQNDANLAGIRDKAALEKLPAGEREAFAQLWADVATLLKRAQEKPN
jgi:serine/threonine-protein kinase